MYVSVCLIYQHDVTNVVANVLLFVIKITLLFNEIIIVCHMYLHVWCN